MGWAKKYFDLFTGVIGFIVIGIWRPLVTQYKILQVLEGNRCMILALECRKKPE